MSETQPMASTSTAPYRTLPRTVYTSVEYPGPVSSPSALLSVVSQEDINDCFNSTSKDDLEALEIRYRGLHDRQSVPVRGVRVPSQKVLLKVVRRRRKLGKGGVFTAEIVGTVANTVRFRSMADWHHTPPQDGPVSQIVRSMIDLDYNAILEYSVPRLDENYTEPDGDSFRSLLELQPAPMMSLRHLPSTYNYKMPPRTVEEEVYDEQTGQTKKRFINKARHFGFSLQVIGHGHTPDQVPTKAAPAVEERIPVLDQNLLARLKKLLEDRPVWMRWALLAHFTEDEKLTIVTNKTYLPAVSYTMGAGPFWKALIRLGYDPCADPEARFYQRIHFFTQVNRSKNGQNPVKSHEDSAPAMKPPGWWYSRQEELIQSGKRPPIDFSKEYIFDGKVLNRDRPDFLLCDITDPLIAKYINDPTNVTRVCDPKDGWYNNATMELIKNIFRIKFIHLYETGTPASDVACAEYIAEYQDVLQAQKDKGEDLEDMVMRRIRTYKPGVVVPPLGDGTEEASELAVGASNSRRKRSKDSSVSTN